MVPVALQQLELEGAGDAAGGPRDGVGFVPTHHQAADLLLVVREAIGVAQRGEVARHLRGEGLGDDVLVLDRNERHVDAHRRAQRPGPLPAAHDHLLAFDAPRGTVRTSRDHRTHDAVDHLDLCDLGVLADGDSLHARTPGERHGDVARVGLSVGGQERRAHDVVDLHDGPQVLCLLW